MKTFVCTLLLAVAASSAFAQDAPTADPIKGIWKLPSAFTGFTVPPFISVTM
jgi:hypothetical protein